MPEQGTEYYEYDKAADLPHLERELVMRALTTLPVNRWLDVSVVQTMPDSPYGASWPINLAGSKGMN